MDGKQRNPSLTLVFASVPIQALLMAGVAATLFSGASSSQPVQYGYGYSVTNPNGDQINIWVKPGPVCWYEGKGPANLPAGPGQYSAAVPVTPVCQEYLSPDPNSAP